MFGNFTEESRKALNLAKKEMKELHHPFVGSEHLLLGILSLKNSLTNKLRTYNLTYKRFRDELIRVVGISNETSNWFLYTPLLKRILERVINDAKDLDEEITVNNLFLSIIAEGEGVAVRILMSLNIDIDKIYKDLINNNSKRKNKKLLLEELGIDLNKEALNKNIDPVIGRDKEVNRIIEILSRRTKNNPLLVGYAGVGKTAIIEELSRRIINSKVPKILKNKRIISLDVSSIVSGTKYRGDFEEKMKKIINELLSNPDIILFVDEIHTMVGAGSAEGAIDASNILKPYLARGKIRIIGSTTYDEYKKSIEKDKALDRRFQKVKIEEPDKETLKQILMNLKHVYSSYHGVVIKEKIIDEIINLSSKYIFDRFEPDRSIDILDEVASKVSLKEIREEIELNDINDELLKLKKIKKIALKNDDYKTACEIKEKELDLLDYKNNLELIISNKKKNKVITINDVRDIISLKSDVPIIYDEKNLEEKIITIEKELKNSIIGQDDAVKSLLEVTKKIRLGIKPSNRSYSLLFSGDTGVGKTFLAKKYGSLITNNIIKLDMNEYTLKENINKLIGSPPGYVGYEDNKNLLEEIRNKPYSVLILDEIEKAPKSIINFFLNILDEGYCIDNKGNKIRFDNVIIIMTTNAIISKSSLGFINNTKSDYTSVFPKEFLNRIDEIIQFNKLSYDDISLIIEKEINKFNVRNNTNFALDKSELEDIIMKSNYEVYGARKLYRLIKKNLDNKLVEYLIGK